MPIDLRLEALLEHDPAVLDHGHLDVRERDVGTHVVGAGILDLASATKIIMPAFGSLTGGLDAHHPEILRSVGGGAAALVPVSDRLLRFPLAA